MDMDFDMLRKYRFELHYPVTVNETGHGIAFFDIISLFVAMFLLDNFVLKLDAKMKMVYYLSAFPIGVISHSLLKQPTFLNSQLDSKEFNVYHLFMILILGAIIIQTYKAKK